MEETRRELTREEKRDIKKLVKSSCANYDREYGCLPLDCECYMFGKWWTGGFCRYFENAVLPLNPVLESSLMGTAISEKLKECPICSKLYTPTTSQAYCSEKCKKTGQLEDARNRQKKWRNSKAHRNEL